ncbi:glycosyltransferase [Pseudoalteromonas sp. AS71]|uniref:glycosyltransferase n=1 Tax=Pseudoalteromonas sp. AS71 TaxID=3135777 RepID=UPI0031784D69
MKVALIVDDYPAVSQSFINRLISELAKHDDLQVDILTVNYFDIKKLKILSINNYELLSNGRIRVQSYSSRNKFSLSFIMTFFRYVKGLIINNERSLSILGLFNINLKYHVKAAMLRELLKTNQYDIIHAQFMTIAIYSVLAKSSIPCGQILAYGRGSDVSIKSALKPCEVKLLENKCSGVSKYLFVSESLKVMAIGKGISSSKCSVVHSGISIDEFEFNIPRVIDDSCTIKILQVGRLVDKKGILLSIKILERFLGKVKFIFTVVGDGPLRAEAYRLCEDKKLLEHVIFVGSKSSSECIEIMKEHDVLLVPSLTGVNGDSEGIPNVAKEAMALGCIVVASDHSGLKELVQHEVSGYVFKENNLEDFYFALNYAFSTSSNWERIAINAREVIENKFCAEKIGEYLLGNYLNAKKNSKS